MSKGACNSAPIDFETQQKKKEKGALCKRFRGQFVIYLSFNTSQKTE
jgi:hypothetical protein